LTGTIGASEAGKNAQGPIVPVKKIAFLLAGRWFYE
jgi:hypothetical protein